MACLMAARTESKDRMAENASPTDHSSRLLELLRRVGREESGTVGFGRPRQGPARRAALVLAAALPSATPEYLTAARDAGADAAFVPVTTDVAAVASTGDGASWPVCGLATVTQRVTPADLDVWQAAGIDAVALQPRDALAACFSPRRQGLLALLDQQLPLEGLRAAAALTVDAFVLQDTQQAGRLTGDDLLWLTLAGSLVRGPAMLLSSRVVAEDLEALVAVGITGIAVRFDDGSAVEQVRQTLAELRRAVDSLDPHLWQGRRERTGLGPVTIPSGIPLGEA
jgi:hypothetical protein